MGTNPYQWYGNSPTLMHFPVFFFTTCMDMHGATLVYIFWFLFFVFCSYLRLCIYIYIYIYICVCFCFCFVADQLSVMRLKHNWPLWYCMPRLLSAEIALVSNILLSKLNSKTLNYSRMWCSALLVSRFIHTGLDLRWEHFLRGCSLQGNQCAKALYGSS